MVMVKCDEGYFLQTIRSFGETVISSRRCMFPSLDAVRQLVFTLIDRLVAWRGGRFTMGNLMGNSSSTFLPEGIRKLNDSIWQFYCPSPEARKVEIIFFHGLHRCDYQEAFWKTWLSRHDESVVWPKDWLSKSFPEARILSVSYDSSVQKRDGQPDPFIITENLIQDMIRYAHVGQTCPVVLVGHSLGSIIIKEVLLGCIRLKSELDIARSQTWIREIDNFLENCKGVFYYSPTHGGSRILDKASPIWSSNEPLIKLLKTLSTDTSRTNYRFDPVRRNLGIKTHTIRESRQTTFMGIKAILVEEASARPGGDGFYTAPDADHFEVCKAEDNTTCAIFKQLETFIKETLQTEDSSRITAKEEKDCLSEQEYPTWERAEAWAEGKIELTVAEQDRTILWLVKCLNDHDNREGQESATLLLSSLTELDRKNGSTDIRIRIAKKKGAIDGLVKCFSEDSHHNLLEGAAWALCDLFFIGHDDAIKSSIAKEDGAISGLVRCLSKYEAGDLQEAAAWNLCHLTEIGDSLKLSVANEEGAISGLVKCLASSLVKPKTRDAAAYTLCSLIKIHGHDSIKLRIAKDKGGIAGLVFQCLSAEEAALRESATVALCSLAEIADRLGDQSIRASIVKEGGARVLT